MKAYINGLSYYLPKKVLNNEMISKEHPEWAIEKIASKTGINKRHISSSEETTGTMAFNAAQLFFEEHKIAKNKIDYILFCTQSPDYVLPTTACILQDKLGLEKHIGALDFNLGCSGYVYGLGLAKGLLLSQQAKNILLITSETYSKYIHPEDKANKTLFGDAATVSLITVEPNTENYIFEILDFEYSTDGSGYDNLIVKNSSWNNRKYDQENEIRGESGEFISNDDYLYMNGPEIFNFTAFQVPTLLKKILNKNKLSIADIEMFIFHQANAYMLDFIRKRCGIPQEHFFISIEDVGNTVSSTIPIALKRYVEKTVQKNKFENIILVGFGVGLSMGAVAIRRIH